MIIKFSPDIFTSPYIFHPLCIIYYKKSVLPTLLWPDISHREMANQCRIISPKGRYASFANYNYKLNLPDSLSLREVSGVFESLSNETELELETICSPGDPSSSSTIFFKLLLPHNYKFRTLLVSDPFRGAFSICKQ